MLRMYKIIIFALTPLPLKEYVLYTQLNVNNYGRWLLTCNEDITFVELDTIHCILEILSISLNMCIFDFDQILYFYTFLLLRQNSVSEWILMMRSLNWISVNSLICAQHK